MSLNMEETISYRGRPLRIETTIDPSEPRITSLLSTDEAVVDVRTVRASRSLKGLGGTQRLEAIQSLLEKAHRYVKTRLLSGRYDQALDAVGTEASPAGEDRQSASAGLARFEAVEQGPEEFAHRRLDGQVLDALRAGIEEQIRRRQFQVGPLAAEQDKPAIPPSAQAASTQAVPTAPATEEVAPPRQEVAQDVGGDCAFPRLAEEQSEVLAADASPPAPGQTADLPRQTQFTITNRPPSTGCTEEFYQWATTHSFKAVHWIYSEASSWMMKRQPEESLQELEKSSPWKSFLASWDSLVQQLSTSHVPATTAWISRDRCVVIVFDGDEAVTALVPSRLLGVTLSAAERIIDLASGEEELEGAASQPKLPTPKSRRRPVIGGS